MLKKICVIISAIILIVSLYINNKVPVFSGLANSYQVHLTDYSDTLSELSVDKREFIFLSGVKGESCVVEKDNFDLQEYLQKMKAKIVFTHFFNQYQNYYAYSPKIKYYKIINGKMINLHVAIKEGKIKIGSPIIYGSF